MPPSERVSTDALVGIDSDGCVFDSMRLKQCAHFHPLIISFWNLEPVAATVREVAEFVNLDSVWRGQNRFTALLKTFELLSRHEAVRSAGIPLPDDSALRAFVESGRPLSQPALQDAIEQSNSPTLRRVLEWSLAVNADMAGRMRDPTPFPGARECLALIHRHARAVVVSQTPADALQREWNRNGLVGLVDAIAGQEAGPKSRQLLQAANGRYPPERILMIGDALGDWHAAEAIDALFFPIIPGEESASWERFRMEGFDRFLRGDFAGAYAQALIDAFRNRLPDTPPWEPPVDKA